jgi:hypothetical protein
MDDAADDPGATEARGIERMAEAGAAIVAGVEQHAVAWTERVVTGLADHWGRLDPERRDALIADARDAGGRARARVTAELRAFFALDVAQQRTTPLAIVRTLRTEATEVLARAGIPPVERDPYEVRAFPDDIYGIVPHALIELGDDDLGPTLLVWGLAKSAVLRARSNRHEGS